MLLLRVSITIDDSNLAIENMNATSAPSTESKFNLPVMMTLDIWVIVANTLTLVTIAKHVNLQTKAYFLVGSLAVVDLTVGVINLALCAAYLVIIGKGIQLDLRQTLNMCTAMQSLWITPVMNSLYHLVLVAGERYIAVLHSLRYEQLVTTPRLKVLIGCSWVLSHTHGLSVFGWLDQLNPSCSTSFLDLPSSYFIPMLAVPMLSCTVIVIFLYGRIFMAARAQLIRINHEMSISSVTPTSQQTGGRHQQLSGKFKLAKMFALIVGVYMVCTLPIFLMCTIGHVAGINIVTNISIFPTLIVIVSFMLISNSGMNFFIYVAKDKNFRVTLLAMLCPKKYSL